ncbi:hypothetical protein ACFV1N_39480 [Streptosporangium canum]|uniref:hypothetical protein n=1 Tax=Streptosporangium canum TaxID=324952 RepID=UPI00368E2F61
MVPLPLPPLAIYRTAVVLWCGKRTPSDEPPVADIAWVHGDDSQAPSIGLPWLARRC